jgi:hypothetical protein
MRRKKTKKNNELKCVSKVGLKPLLLQFLTVDLGPRFLAEQLALDSQYLCKITLCNPSEIGFPFLGLSIKAQSTEPFVLKPRSPDA